MLADETSPDLALVEVGLDGNPPGVAAAVHISHRFGIPVVFIVGAPDPGDVLRHAAASNPCGYLHQPFSDAQLDLTIRCSLAVHARQRAQRDAQIKLQRRVARLEDLCQRTRSVFDSPSDGVVVLNEDHSPLSYQDDLIGTAFRSISDGIVVLGVDGEFLYTNPAAEQIIGRELAGVPPDKLAETYGVRYADRETRIATEDIFSAIQLGVPVDELEVFIRHPRRPDGVYISVSTRPLMDEGGRIRGTVAVFRDVTARVRAAEALAQAFAEGRLEMADTIVHDIGNAIVGVTTGIEKLRKALADDRFGRSLAALADAVRTNQEDWVDYLRDHPQGRRVPPFVTALADRYIEQRALLISTVERVLERAQHIVQIVRTGGLGTTAMDRKNVDLNDALATALMVVRNLLAKNEIKTTIDSRNAPQEIHVSESQFQQMLVNLIKNAIEAIDDLAAEQGLSQPPYIRVRVWREGRFMNLEVTDNGIGLKTKDQRALLAPGYTTKKSGMGLGLHSVANFVISSGGRIRPTSDGYGKGTTMRVMLPLESVVPHRAQVDAPQAVNAGRIAP